VGTEQHEGSSRFVAGNEHHSEAMVKQVKVKKPCKSMI
jgi:hypothetical protein